MRNVVYFMLLCIVITGIGIGSYATDDYSYGTVAVILVLKGLFIYGVLKRSERKRKRREQEELFNEYMRSQILRNRGY